MNNSLKKPNENVKTLTGHTHFVRSVVYSPDGRYIVSGSLDETIRIWDASTQLQIGKPLTGHTNSVRSVAYSPDGRHIVSGSGDNTIRIWDVLTQRQIGNPLTGHTNSVTSVAYSPDGQHIVSGSADRTIRIWNNPIPVYRTYLKPYLITNLIGVVMKYI